MQEALAAIARGVTVRELALRYGISQSTLRRYKAGRYPGQVPIGRPRALSDEDEEACYRAWDDCEAGLYELASIHRVCPQTMRNIIRRRARAALELQVAAYHGD